MSLFNFSGGGDIWSSAGFAFVSPINDILDKESFTLEEILAQDEVLQEVKSLNIKLVEFLSKESSVREMMSFLADPPPEGAPDNRVFKFPYMSCEIICCEVPEILSAVAKDGGGGDSCPLKKLFSLLEQEGDIDAHRAGYLEKVLTVLLKHRCGATTAFVNEGGVELFGKMVRHLGNFSVMQVAKLLLLPKYAALQDIDATALMGDGRGGLGGSEDGGAHASLWCNWSDDPEILKMLLAEFNPQPVERGGGSGGGGAEGGGEDGGDCGESSDMHLHLSELLLALIAQSSPESSFLKRMFSKETVDALVAAATLSKEQGRQAKGSQAALQILAALADRLVRPLPPTSSLMQSEATEMQVDLAEGFGGGGDGAEGGNGGGGGAAASPEFLNVDGDVLERGLMELVPSLCAYLRGHTEDPTMITAQTRQEQPRMGALRLQVVRFLETLVGMDSPAIDQVLIQENAMATCLEMMFTYETSSMLHTSVAASVLAILIPADSPPGANGIPGAGPGGRRGSASSSGEAAAAAAEDGEGSEAGSSAAAGDGAEDDTDGGSGSGAAKAGGGRREPFQRHLFEDCRLLERILEAVALNEDAEKAQREQAPMADSEAQEQAAAPAEAEAEAEAEGGVVDGAGRGADGESAAAAAAAPEGDGTAAGEGSDTAAVATEAPEHSSGAAATEPAGMQTEGEGGAQEAAAAAAAGTGGGDWDDAGAAGEGSGAGEGARRRSRPGRRLGHMGHVLLLSRAIMGAEIGEQGGSSSGSSLAPGGGGGGMLDGSEGADDGGDGEGGAGGEGEQSGGGAAAVAGEGAGAVASASSGKNFVAGLLARRECAEHWHEFVNTTLADEMSRQMNPLGGFTVPSREDENQLSSDFPDQAVDMDDTSGLLENISRMQAGGGGGEDGGTAPKNSFLHDDEDIDDEFGNGGGGGGGGDNNGLGMMFGSVNFMSSAGTGSAWGSLANEHGSSNAGGGGSSAFGSSAGDSSSSSVNEGWANFADFGDAQQQSPGSTGAGGSGSGSAGGFANFDSVFSATAPPGPAGFAPAPPSWAPRAGEAGESGGAAADAGSGGAGGEGGFADFQYGFADFSAMMDDTVTSPPVPPPVSGEAFGVSDDGDDGRGGGGGGGGAADDDRMDEEGEDGAEPAGAAAAAAEGGGLELLLGTSPREAKCDSLDAMMGSDEEEEEKEIEGGGLDSVSP